jgi:hypothetical protein
MGTDRDRRDIFLDSYQTKYEGACHQFMAEAFRERLLTVLNTLQPKPPVAPNPQYSSLPMVPTASPAPPVISIPAAAPVMMMPYSTYVAPRAKIPWNFLWVAVFLAGLGLGIAIAILIQEMREQKSEKRKRWVQ